MESEQAIIYIPKPVETSFLLPILLSFTVSEGFSSTFRVHVLRDVTLLAGVQSPHQHLQNGCQLTNTSQTLLQLLD